MIENLLYSPTFFGATLQDNFTVLLNLDQNSLGNPSSEVKKSVKHLCGLLTPEMEIESINIENYYKIAKDYYTSIEESDSTGIQLEIFLLLLSSYFHEMRHAHDLISTTIGQEILFNGFNCYQNTPAIMNSLSSWLSKDITHRIPLPLKDNANEVNTFCNDFSRINDNYKKFNSDFQAFQMKDRASSIYATTTNLLEASAVSVQLDFIHDLFGVKAVHILTQLIQQSEQGGLYLRILNDLRDIFHKHGYEGNELGAMINYLIWLSLNGSTFANGNLSDGPSTVLIFEGLIDHVARKRKCQSLMETQDAATEFFKLWGLLPPLEMHNKIGQVLMDRQRNYQKLLKSFPQGNNLEIFSDTYKEFVSAFFCMRNLITAAPLLYFGPMLYGWTLFYNLLPSLHVKVKENGTAYDFMSKGKSIVSFDNWNYICINSSIFKILMEGNHSIRTFVDEMLHDIITEEGWMDVQWRFIDRSGLFNMN